jgi:glycosyltransferase involved in cell wall biosynthesis
MACKTPVIAFDVGCLDEIIESGVNGVLVRQRDIFELAREAQALLDNDAGLELLGKNAYKTILSQYTVEHMSKSIDKIYQSILTL